MTILQYQLWIGFGFALLLIGFLITAFFTAKVLTPDQRTILKVLGALCAGFAGALITGDALFKLNGKLGSGSNFVVSGTAGAAFFFLVWFFFPKVAGFPDAFSFSVPAGWTFRNTVDTLAQQDGAVPDYEGFTEAELNAPLKSWKLKTKTLTEAIKLVGSITVSPNAIRKYDVTLIDSVYRLHVS